MGRLVFHYLCDYLIHVIRTDIIYPLINFLYLKLLFLNICSLSGLSFL